MCEGLVKIAPPTPMTRLRFHDEAFPGRPAFDTAVSRALLSDVVAGRVAESLRLYRTDEVVAFSPLDAVSPGFEAAIVAARQAGFASIRRLAGGRAAVFHRETLAFAWCRRAEEPRAGVEARFADLAQRVERALVALGADARIGEVPGEYCPGGWSVNARGRKKLMGVGQRLVRNGAHVGGVVVVSASQRVRDALGPVYEALGIDWDPETAGSVSEEAMGVDCDDVVRALLREFECDHDLEPAAIDSQTLSCAEELEAAHALG